jgi:hydroxymethylpyrimidine/phosphomethylpyrimidine kinase
MAAIPNILSIAGFDPSAGAGVLADIKTAEANSVYACGVMTSLTYQNDTDFEDVDWINTEHIIRQIHVLSKRMSFAAIKIGLISDVKSLQTIVSYVQEVFPDAPIIWDPILAASAGYEFHNTENAEEWFAVLKEITLITPNRLEAQQLFNTTDEAGIRRMIANKFLSSVLLKGGHSETDQCNDVLITASEKYVFEGPKLTGFQKHGTGCILSTAIACNLAKGMSLIEACRKGKNYVTKAITSNDTLLAFHSINA